MWIKVAREDIKIAETSSAEKTKGIAKVKNIVWNVEKSGLLVPVVLLCGLKLKGK